MEILIVLSIAELVIVIESHYEKPITRTRTRMITNASRKLEGRWWIVDVGCLHIACLPAGR